MVENVTLTSAIVAFFCGLALGAGNLGVLWLVLRRLPALPCPTFWLMTSAALRMTLVLLGFYWIMDGHWPLLLASLFGFIVIRVVTTSWLRTIGTHRALPS